MSKNAAGSTKGGAASQGSPPPKSGSSFFYVRFLIFGLGIAYVAQQALSNSDFLNGYSSDTSVSGWQIQLGLYGFCASPLVNQIRGAVEKASPKSGYHNGTTEYSFEETGGIDEEDYDKSSIYSILYALYADIGETLEYDEKTMGAEGAVGQAPSSGITGSKNSSYQFTFNTWGVAPSDFGESDAQRYGKTSYSWFRKSEIIQEAVKKSIETGKPLKIVEIGCGTGAGANWISTDIFPHSHYTAIDMQKAAIETCKKRHSSGKLDCVHLPEGVGNHGGYQPTDATATKIVNKDGSNSATPEISKKHGQGKIPLDDGSVDFAIILETHIADQQIGPEEKAIFAEIHRVLKKDGEGFFLWGNALPTDVWLDAERYLPTIGFKTLDRWNNTAGAIQARLEDQPRVDKVMEGIHHQYVAFKTLDMPWLNSILQPVGIGSSKEGSIGASCWYVIDKLLRNFYRDPGTALFIKMVEGKDSYMHYVFQLESQAEAGQMMR